METKVEALEENQRKLTITVDAKEVDARIKKTYKDFAFKYNFPGFRKGKAPRPIIDSALGPQAVVATVTDEVLNKLYPLAMDEQNLIAMGQPAFDQDVELVEAGKSFTFTVTVDCRPELELSSYEPVEIELPGVEATDADIDAQIEELRNYYYDFEDAPASAKIEEGSFAEISLSAKDADGQPIDSLQTESRLYESGMGLFPKAFDEGLMGMKMGDEKSIEVDMSEPSLMGQNMADAGKITLDVEIKQVKKKVLPELNDEWAKNTAGFESLAELRQRVAESVHQQKEQMMPRLRENEVLYALQERLKGEAPEALCESEEQNLLQNFFMQMQQQGMTFDAYLAQMNMTPDQFKEDLKKQAKDVSEQDLALDAWARHAGIEVTEEEISEEFTKSGADDVKALEKEWRENGRIAMLRQGMKRTRALDAIMETCKVEETKPDAKTADGKAAKKKPAAKKPAAKPAAGKEASEAPAKKAPAKKAAAKKPAAAQTDGDK